MIPGNSEMSCDDDSSARFRPTSAAFSQKLTRNGNAAPSARRRADALIASLTDDFSWGTGLMASDIAFSALPDWC